MSAAPTHAGLNRPAAATGAVAVLALVGLTGGATTAWLTGGTAETTADGTPVQNSSLQAGLVSPTAEASPPAEAEPSSEVGTSTAPVSSESPPTSEAEETHDSPAPAPASAPTAVRAPAVQAPAGAPYTPPRVPVAPAPAPPRPPAAPPPPAPAPAPPPINIPLLPVHPPPVVEPRTVTIR